jgi:dCMP deaminase
MTEWHERFLTLAEHIAQWSKDPSTKVGAVIVDPQRRIVSTGYNGAPQSVSDVADVPRERKLMRTLHAEANAILFAKRDLTGCTIYVTHHPCAHCAAMIIQAGITTVEFRAAEFGSGDHWNGSMYEAQLMMTEGGVKYGANW